MSFNFDEENIVRERRSRLLKKLNIRADETITPRLVHGDKVLVVDNSHLGNGTLDWRTAPRVDALITNHANVYLMMLVGDCLPIILYDQKKKVLGLVHAGWKGVENRITQKTIKEMKSTFGSKPRDMIVSIGPCIRKDSYRFEEVVQKSPERIKTWEQYLSENDDGTTSINLVEYVRDQLKELGVTSILDCGIDTAVDSRFFSHYRDKRAKLGDIGRFACIVGIV